MFRDAGTGTSAAVYGSKAGVSASATLENGAGWDIGAHGAALKLDGEENYALAPEMVGNPALEQITVCVWAKFASTHKIKKKVARCPTSDFWMIGLFDSTQYFRSILHGHRGRVRLVGQFYPMTLRDPSISHFS